MLNYLKMVYSVQKCKIMCYLYHQTLDRRNRSSVKVESINHTNHHEKATALFFVLLCIV